MRLGCLDSSGIINLVHRRQLQSKYQKILQFGVKYIVTILQQIRLRKTRYNTPYTNQYGQFTRKFTDSWLYISDFQVHVSVQFSVYSFVLCSLVKNSNFLASDMTSMIFFFDVDFDAAKSFSVHYQGVSKKNVQFSYGPPNATLVSVKKNILAPTGPCNVSGR